MYIRVSTARDGFVAARVGLVAAEFIPGAEEVKPMRTWVGRFVKHTSSAAARFAAMVAGVAPMVVAVDLVVGSFALFVARITLAATKVALVVVEVVLVVARVLEQCSKIFQTESGHSHPGKWMIQAEHIT